MNNLILENLKEKLKEINPTGDIDVDTCLNGLKEELQYYVLDFIYHHPLYNKWVMYGGSSIRIIHNLNRMSVDLDFEINDDINNVFLNNLENDISSYFLTKYGVDNNFLTIKQTNERGLTLKFNIGDELNFGNKSTLINVKIDLNHFAFDNKSTEKFPIVHNQFSFVILTYNLSTLMASKIVAIFLRGERSINKDIYNEKGRDIYDLIWYMNKKIIPNLSYLKKKGVEFDDHKGLFDRLTIKMNSVSEKNLKDDLTPLFLNKYEINNWLNNWLNKFMQSKKEYNISTIKSLEKVEVYHDLMKEVCFIVYKYNTEEHDKHLKIVYRLSDYWLDYLDGKLLIDIDKEIENKISITENGYSSSQLNEDNLKKYATIFLEKNKKYFTRNNNIIMTDFIDTKLIRMTADRLNPLEQILLDKSTLISCDLEDLLK